MSRDLICAAIDELIGLGRDGPDRTKRAVLRKCVTAFNRLERRREFIETVEREQLHELLSEVAEAAGLELPGDLLDAWRDW